MTVGANLSIQQKDKLIESDMREFSRTIGNWGSHAHLACGGGHPRPPHRRAPSRNVLLRTTDRCAVARASPDREGGVGHTRGRMCSPVVLDGALAGVD